MKILPGICILICGLLIGWFARGSGTGTPDAETAMVVRESKRTRPTDLTRTSPQHRLFLPERGNSLGSGNFESWIGAMNAGNAGQYFEAAISEEATDRDFLKHPSAEAYALLHQLGKHSGSTYINELIRRDLKFAAVAVMEGWSASQPEEAFAWTCERKKEQPGEQSRLLFAKAAGAMVDVNFDQVWMNVRNMDDPLANELVARKGFQGANEMLTKYWIEPPQGSDETRAHEVARIFGDWNEYANIRTFPSNSPSMSSEERWAEHAKLTTARYEELLKLNLIPAIRNRIQSHLERIRTRPENVLRRSE